MSGWLKDDPVFTTASDTSTDGRWRYIEDLTAEVCGVSHHKYPDLAAHCGRTPHPIGGPHVLMSDVLIERGIRLVRAEGQVTA